MKYNKLPISLIAIGIVLVLIQFFPIDKTNPPINEKLDFIQNRNPPAEIAAILKTACYDCHSSTTKYPWYTNIQPAAWWISGHIHEGRNHLNFSKWTAYTAEKRVQNLEKMVEMVEGKQMPMLSYMIGHKEAWIDANQRAALVEWFKAEGKK